MLDILYKTAVRTGLPIGFSKQVVHIPTTLLGVRGGSYTRQIKGIQAQGTVMIREAWGAEHHATYGICRHANREIMCIRRYGDEHWTAIEARPIEKGTGQ